MDTPWVKSHKWRLEKVTPRRGNGSALATMHLKFMCRTCCLPPKPHMAGLKLGVISVIMTRGTDPRA